ncbi:MAG: SDR family oxidoreductase [Candidatus Magasanikbacteria bacterium]|nr:SDR family oxidoreductase [Candidatus Magasanikbacteria bacterium]
MKRILVTGGAGFIGSHLCQRLLNEGNKVICLDNFLTGSKDNIERLFDNPLFIFVEHDIIDPITINEPVDEIYNLACPASPIHYQKNAIRTIKVNTLGVINTLGFAKAIKAKVLQASTSEIYGEPLEHPQTEQYRGNVSSIGPRACYDEGKRCAEALFFEYRRSHGLNIKVVRIFNTYGTHMSKDDGRVISNFIVQALTNQDITIQGDGSQTRSFCYVDDLVDGMMQTMATSNDFTGPVNLGNPNEVSIKEIAELILKLTGSSSRVVYKELPTDDPTRRCPDIRMAKQALGWEPKINLETGLLKTIEYFKSKI